MKLINLASSSAGNCQLIKVKVAENKEKILMMECGLSYKELQSKVVSYKQSMGKVDCCLITHGHRDHCAAAKEIANRGIPIFASENTKKIVGSDKVKVIEPLKPIAICDSEITITAFPVAHDIDGSFGFIIESDYEKILYVTDAKYFDVNLSMFDFDYVFIECNFDTKQTYALYHQAKKENDLINMKRFGRVIDSHMGLFTTIKQLSHLNLKNCKGIFLLHLSDRNANENKFKIVVEDNLRKKTFVLKKNGGIL